MTKFTYLTGRKCLHCGAPIPDQKHLALKFCDYKELGKTSKESCKNKYWSKKKTKDLKAYRSLIKFHKSMNRRLTHLVLNKGETITANDINEYGIDLSSPVRLCFDQNKKKSFYYIGYIIIEITNNQYKIKAYELLFR